MKLLFYKWINTSPDIFTKCGSEFLACILFHLLGSLSPTPWCNAIVLMNLVFFTAKLSGGHLNPVITFVFFSLGYTNPVELLLYWISQIGGCMIGALFLKIIVPSSLHLTGCFYPNSSLTNSQVLACECFATFAFVICVFSVVWYTQNKQGYGIVGPIMVGLSLLGPALSFGHITGSALNPARALASFAAYGCNYGDNNTVGYYVAGEFIGSVFAIMFILPWYGICRNAWYNLFMSEKYFEWMKQYKTSIEIVSNVA
jgi:glycerol uptake facilitator-like aquaporin